MTGVSLTRKREMSGILNKMPWPKQKPTHQTPPNATKQMKIIEFFTFVE